MCEGRGQKVRAVFCRVVRTTSRALSLSSPVVFLYWRERQRFPTLAVSFVSLSTVLAKQQHSVLEYTSSLSILPPPHILPTLPHLSTHSLTSYPPPPAHPRVSPTSPISQRFSHALSPIVSSPLLFFSLYLSISLTSCLFLSHLSLLRWIADSWETVHKGILFITSRCTLHDPSRLFPPPRHSATRCVHAYLRELAQPCIEYLVQSCTWRVSKHLLPY